MKRETWPKVLHFTAVLVYNYRVATENFKIKQYG